MAFYRRKLPHWFPEGKHLFFTWRLYGSLPLAILQSLKADDGTEMGKRFVRFDRELDRANAGPKWLGKSGVALIVEREILEGAARGWYVMHSYVIMPNHVHVLLEPKIQARRITQAMKGRSARACNLALGRVGLPFWQQESFDHWVRDASSFAKISAYIERNPVSAGLVRRPEDWRWSSAHVA